ncbi:MAG: amidophosphoribosyltransferase [Desulfotomaculaceae bacterium]|nr:amidophosphoribosyltransferase [Desulfotomaculaceae bacterium]
MDSLGSGGLENQYAGLLERDKPGEECGVFGIYGPGLNVAKLTYYGLYALQHRGQESAGIAVGDGKRIHLRKGMGLVSEVFKFKNLDVFQGDVAVGHVRYSTAGAGHSVNAQPLVFRCAKGMFGLAHNGDLTNITELRSQLLSTGSVFQSSTDSEVIANLIARHGQGNLADSIVKTMGDIKGAYALLIITEKSLIGVRDPHGLRPLCLGRRGDAFVLASESCALNTVGADFVRDVEPGEIVIIDNNGLTSKMAQPGCKKAHCIFEYIYFARPDSRMNGFNVSKVRREMGRQLAREYPVEADIVIPVPDSGKTAAWGFAQESGIPYEEGLMKNRYIGRTFIQPGQDNRNLEVRIKLNPVRDVLEGKRVVVVDDSIVRGTTSCRIVRMIRDCGAKEVHFCLSSPPIRKSCYYGIDTSDEDELIAASKSAEEIGKFIDADGIHFLSLEGLLGIFGEKRHDFCTACFSGNYPVEIPTLHECGKYDLE